MEQRISCKQTLTQNITLKSDWLIALLFQDQQTTNQHNLQIALKTFPTSHFHIRCAYDLVLPGPNGGWCWYGVSLRRGDRSPGSSDSVSRCF